MKCVDCKHFRIEYEPYRSGGVLWDFGKAVCDKHDLVADFSSKRQLNKLTCVEDKPNDKHNVQR